MLNTKQEALWVGEFGNEYTARNKVSQKVLSETSTMFSRMLSNAHGISSILEMGAGIGKNIKVLRSMFSDADISAIEINSLAAEQLLEISGVTVYQQSLLDFVPKKKYDLAFTCGVLIHIAPELLHDAYKIVYNSSSKYIIISEYYNPVPVEVHYRGQAGVLFKRDFAGEILDAYSDIRLIDYGFFYHREVESGSDMTWFLLEKV